jgi:hypothetical protein
MDYESYFKENPYPYTEEQLRLCEGFITEHYSHTKTMRRRTHLGVLKHLVENATKTYIPREAFVKAMQRAGFRMERRWKRTYYFNVTVHSSCWFEHLKKFS